MDTARFVLEELQRDTSSSALFEAAEAAGHDLARVVDVLHSPFDQLPEDDAYEIAGMFDVLDVLIEHYGVERAAAIALRSRAFATVDVGRHRERVASMQRLHTAITERRPIADVYASMGVTECEGDERHTVLWRLVSEYPVSEVVTLAPTLEDEDARIMGEDLRARLSALDALHTLAGSIDDGLLLHALERLWQCTQASDAVEPLVATFARLSRDAGRSVTPVMRFAAARSEAERWLPALQSYGLDASQAALHLMEAGLAPPAIAALLAMAGYDDEAVMTALLKNGLGARRSLALMRDGGWSLEGMVEALHRRGALLPEVRGHLAELHVPADTQRSLALRHWDEAIVELVLGREPNTSLR